MSNQMKSSLRTSAALGALLLLAATTSGCGVGLPTQPDLGQTVSRDGVANSMSAQDSPGSMEIGDESSPAGGSDTSVIPAPETVIPTPSGHGTGGWAYGHQKDKWKHRNP